MEQKDDIAALLESLCEHPLVEVEASPELEALRREAGKTLWPAGAARPEGDDVTDVDTLRAALAALLSGTGGEAARRTVADAVLRSAPARLDAQSALAFVSAIEQSPQSAPARLVNEILARDIAGAAPSAAPREREGIAKIWSLIGGRSRPARRWRVAAVCAVLLMVSVVPLYRMQTNPAIEAGAPSPTAKTSNNPSAAVDVAAPSKPMPAMAQPCEPRRATSEANKPQSIAPADAPTPPASTATAECAPTPGRDVADHPANETEAVAARQRAEAARQAAAARKAAKVGAARANRSINGDAIGANRPGPAFGTIEPNMPTPSPAAPAGAPATPLR